MDLKETILAVTRRQIDLQEKKLDKVDKDELEGDYDEREDKDLDNDGDTDSSDEYLHKRRKAVKNSIRKAEIEEDITNESTMAEAVHKTWEVTFKNKAHKPLKVKARNTAEAMKKGEAAHKKSGSTAFSPVADKATVYEEVSLAEGFAICYKGKVWEKFDSKEEAKDSLDGMNLSASDLKDYKIKKISGGRTGMSGKNMKEDLDEKYNTVSKRTTQILESYGKKGEH